MACAAPDAWVTFARDDACPQNAHYDSVASEVCHFRSWCVMNVHNTPWYIMIRHAIVVVCRSMSSVIS